MNNDKYISVSTLSKYLKYKFDTDEHLQMVYLRGEISNFKLHSRGHMYFSIKDDTSKINAIMFSTNAKDLTFEPIDGMNVLICGKVSVYEPTGNYQIYVNEMLQDGLGNLYLAYEKLKAKLALEGLFDESHKQVIPQFPNRIGIVTAKTGAAIKDILTTIKRRFPICETLLIPCLVQGNEAAASIVNALKISDQQNLDVIILARGGGSIEDLWCFNEETVARTIYECQTPIISAVGHEIDFTISDFVADLRAPTPTGAAELATPNIIELKLKINNEIALITRYISSLLDSQKLTVKRLLDSYILKNQSAIYEVKEQKIDHLFDKLNTIITNRLETYQVKLFELKNSYLLNNPVMLYQKSDQKLSSLVEKITLLNPMNTLNRGFAIVRYNGKIIKKTTNIKINDEINIELAHGHITSTVMKVEE